MLTDRRRAAALCGFAAVAFAFGTAIIGAAARPGYSHRSQFISELGESGAADGLLVSAAGFAPTGLLVLLFLAFLAPQLPRSWRTTIGLLAFGAVGVAYVVSAMARCDAGCPATGSLSQSVHNLFGALEYVGAFIGLVLLGGVFHQSATWRSFAPLSFACAALVGVGFVGILVPPLAPVRGASQRVAEAGIFLWVVLVSVALLADDAGRRGQRPR